MVPVFSKLKKPTAFLAACSIFVNDGGLLVGESIVFLRITEKVFY